MAFGVIRSRSFLFLVFLAILTGFGGLATPSFSQVLTGTLAGTVVDPQDNAVPGAKVTITDLSTAKQFMATTNQDGSFTVPGLPFGFFSVEIEASGFAKYVVGRLQVNVSQVATVSAKLELAKVGTTVVVEARQNVIETESAELKNSVDRTQIINLPLPTRNPLDLVRTMPGIVTPTSSTIADAFVHGLRGNSTNLTQDGVNVADNFVKTSSFFAISAPTVDTVGEFNVSIGGIGVDGGFGAAQVSIVTQRGSNDFHGSLFWFQRTNALNANTWFNNAQGIRRPFQLQNRVGASAGGPVYIPKVYNGKNRTWVFGTFERFSEPLARSRTRTVLTQDARQGMFTYIPTCTAATCPAGITPGQPRTVNLLSLGRIGNTGATPAINQDVINFYNSLVPNPNTNLGCSSDTFNIGCFAFNLPGSSIQKRYTLRGDHQLTRSHSIEFVFNQADFNSSPDLLNGIEPQFPKSSTGSQVSRRQVFTGALHSTFGSNKTNEARVGFQRAPVTFAYPEQFGATGGFQLTLPRVTSPLLTSGNLPQGRNTPVRQVTDNFAWVKGRNTFRFGGEYRQVVAGSFFFNTVIPRILIASTTNAINPGNPNGITSSKFQGGISSAALARAQDVFNIVTGLQGQIQEGFNHTSPTSGFVPGKPRNVNPIQHNVGLYFQDTIKVKPNFTLTAGVRWEFQGVFDLRNRLILQPTDRLGGLFGPSGVSNFFDVVKNPSVTDTLLDFAGDRNDRRLYKRSWDNFAPFLGFAWDPWGKGKTSIRGSGALHYTQDGFTLFQNASTGNAGLFTVVANTSPTGVFSSASNPLPSAPVAQFPVSQRANFARSINQNLWVFKPNLITPRVIEWTLSVSRELWNRWTVEARYVGNHASSLFRSTDLNEIHLSNSPFTFNGNSVPDILTEFQNAQNNLAINKGSSFANKGLPGQVPLPIFEALFGSATSSFFGNAGFITNLNQNRVGDLFDTLRRSNNATIQTNRLANFPLNFFVPNPFANALIFVDNSSWSIYHGGELEVRRRFSSGLFFQANYTYGKVLTDSRFLTSQTEFTTFQSLRNPRLDRNRAPFDITHSFSANWVYPLPFGKGKWLGRGAGSLVDKFISGWQVQGLSRWSSGAPFSITTARRTIGAVNSDETAVIQNITPSQLQKLTGVFRTPTGVFWLDPNSGLLNISGSNSSPVLCTPGQTTPCFDFPKAGKFGNTPFFGFHGPRFFNQDLGITKRTFFPKVSEHFNFEIKFEFFNAFNNPNFTLSDPDLGRPRTDLDDAGFGQLPAQVDTVRGGGVLSRVGQWAIRFNW